MDGLGFGKADLKFAILETSVYFGKRYFYTVNHSSRFGGAKGN